MPLSCAMLSLKAAEAGEIEAEKAGKEGPMTDTKTNKMLDPDPRIWDFETEYELGQDNVRPLGLDIHNPVFIVSGLLIVGFVIAALANQEAAASFSSCP